MDVVLHDQMVRGADAVAISATTCGTRRRVIASVDRPSADNWRMSVLVSTFMGLLVAGVGGMVVLRARSGWVLTSVGRQKCLRMGHEAEVDVWP